MHFHCCLSNALKRSIDEISLEVKRCCPELIYLTDERQNLIHINDVIVDGNYQGLFTKGNESSVGTDFHCTYITVLLNYDFFLIYAASQ